MVWGTVLLLRSPQRRFDIKRSIFLLIGSVLLLIVLSVLNGWIEKSWNIDYIRSFLCLMKVSTYHKGYYLRFALSVSYVLIYLSIVQLFFGFFKIGRHDGEGKAYQLKMGMPKSPNVQNEYINARIESSKLQYAMIITLVFIAPLGILYAFVGLLSSSSYILTWAVKAIFIVTCIVWICTAKTFLLLRRYWVFKILTNDTGVVVFGFLTKKHEGWKEIVSMEVVSTGVLFGGKMVEVKTKNGNFFFPLTMKLISQGYPKLDLLAERWVYPEGSKKEITADTCSLYQEIKSRIKT